MSKLGGFVSRVQNGDRYVIEEMRKNNYSLGGEKSGHIIFGNYSTTGDGIIAGLQILKIMKETDKKISELADNMTEFPQAVVNIDVKQKTPFEYMPHVKAKILEIEKILGKTGRMIVRYSGTQNICRIMIEAQNEKEIKTLANELANEIKKEVGA
jgi:phosphoglucosamine mutase